MTKYEEQISLYISAGGSKDENIIYDFFLYKVKNNKCRNLNQFHRVAVKIDDAIANLSDRAFKLVETEMDDDFE